jgi:hypothetical protein
MGGGRVWTEEQKVEMRSQRDAFEIKVKADSDVEALEVQSRTPNPWGPGGEQSEPR